MVPSKPTKTINFINKQRRWLKIKLRSKYAKLYYIKQNQIPDTQFKQYKSVLKISYIFVIPTLQVSFGQALQTGVASLSLNKFCKLCKKDIKPLKSSAPHWEGCFKHEHRVLCIGVNLMWVGILIKLRFLVITLFYYFIF